ncbi:hypothetical protein LK08_09830 [Streptomyces sp. MUSC 125]|uniref:hypothetical protein n=1 Tax=unclassified Streptomyces TaxID=2593676 RepID=UPI00057F3F9E|nr:MULTISPECIES: hypothetical protein [unclassified Streptomyces]KIE27212.1 hypothetical protein LK08_09830 [Streptomyces sp. MUSC 125]MCH0556199.1 hypothetical protein [Streptomyces sp. MUM 16J]
MPTYQEITTTDLSTLTTAADRWEGMAKEFHKQETAYGKNVHGITLGSSWTGFSGDVAQKRLGITLKEFQKAQVEAKAIASVLRDAHTEFVELRKKLESARDDAIAQGMKVSDQGTVSYDTGKLSPGDRQALAHDPDYQESIHRSVASWQARIDQCVKDVGAADKDVEFALQTIVVDTDVTDGTLNGFNGKAQGDLGKYKAEEPPEDRAHTKTDGWQWHGEGTATGPSAGASASGPKYGKEGSAKVYADLDHLAGKGTLSDGDLELSTVGDLEVGARAWASGAMTDKGIAGSVEASAGARALAERRGDYGYLGGTYVRGTGFDGAEAQAGAGADLEGLNAKAKAFAGAKAGVAGGGEIAGIGAGATAEGWAGAGAEAKVSFGKGDDGKFHIGTKVVLALGLGGAVGAEFTVDPHKVSAAAGDAADAVGGAVDAIGDAASSLTDDIASLL